MQLNNGKGAVAAGHKLTVQSAENVLRAGGNAFDAVLAAYFTSFVCEPVLSSLGGGGFMLAHKENSEERLYDFFVQTPVEKKSTSEIEFYPIHANFGSASQEFHIGAGSIATPGSVKGLFAIHNDLCRMPLDTLAEQAVELANNGVEVNAFQSQVFEIIKTIYSNAPGTDKVFETPSKKSEVPVSGEIVKMPLLADFLYNLVREGEDFFYRGEISRAIHNICKEKKGHLSQEDLDRYKVVKRKPLETSFLGHKISMNSPPSSAGVLIAYALALFEGASSSAPLYGTSTTLKLLFEIMKNTHEVREKSVSQNNISESLNQLLDPGLIEESAQKIINNPAFSRGTTHISVADEHGNIASLSTSNGEGSGHYIPGTGIMLNNMLGEEDLNRGGFHKWQENRRMTSMMAPGIVFKENGGFIVFGSGGSNRIRTAIFQVLLNILAFDMDSEEAIDAARLHVEPGLIDIENGFDSAEIADFKNAEYRCRIWPGKNLYFGGVHVVQREPGGYFAYGDPRRGGHAQVIK